MNQYEEALRAMHLILKMFDNGTYWADEVEKYISEWIDKKSVDYHLKAPHGRDGSLQLYWLPLRGSDHTDDVKCLAGALFSVLPVLCRSFATQPEELIKAKELMSLLYTKATNLERYKKSETDLDNLRSIFAEDISMSGYGCKNCTPYSLSKVAFHSSVIYPLIKAQACIASEENDLLNFVKKALNEDLKFYKPLKKMTAEALENSNIKLDNENSLRHCKKCDRGFEQLFFELVPGGSNKYILRN